MSDMNWTDGPWHWDGDPSFYDSDDEAPWLLADGSYRVLHGEIHAASQADARLIAASPEGFDAASAAYTAILKSPLNEWRVEVGMDGTLAMLRDYIAKATDQDPQDVQAEYERQARKARGES